MFSVVIPLFNKEKYVLRAVHSVLMQTNSEYEILIINDGSTDRSLEIVELIKDERIRIINKPNGGESSARNLGIRMANFMFIAFLDADDAWHPNFLREVRELIRKFPDQGIYTTNYQLELPSGRTISALNSRIKTGLIIDYFKESMRFPLVTSNTAVIRSEVFQDVGFFNENLKMGADIDMWYRIVKRYKVVYSSIYGAIYYQNADGRVCDAQREFTLDLFLSIKETYFNGQPIGISEKRYVSELVIKETLRILKVCGPSEARMVLKRCKDLRLPVIAFMVYMILTCLPKANFQLFHKAHIYVFKHF